MTHPIANQGSLGDTMTDCEKSCAQKKKRKALNAWWKIDAVLKDNSLVEIDHIDLEPQPYTSGNEYVYYKKGKKHELIKFQEAVLSIVTLCDDPNCKDPECIAAQNAIVNQAPQKTRKE